MSVWLFTNTCYGTWLPGDPRGSITSVRDRRAEDAQSDARIVHNTFGEPVEPSIPELYQAAQSQMKGPPIHLTRPHAEIVLAQFHETCRFRSWSLLAAAIMYNHFHLVLGIGDAVAKKSLSARSRHRRNHRPGR